MSKTIRVSPGYLGLALDDEGVVDALLYGCREAFNNEGISKGWRVTSVSNQPFSLTFLLEKSKGADYYELQFEKNIPSTWTDTSTWASNQPKCLGKICFDANERFPQLLGLKTKTTGWTMEKATRACRAVPNKLMAIRAGDDESYDLFSPMFDDLILRYHNIDVKTNKAKKENYSSKDIPPLPESGITAIKSTRIRTARNLAGFPFTNNMTKEQRNEIQSALISVFEGFTDERLIGTYYPMEGMSVSKYKELIDKHYLYINNDPTLENSGCYDDWPAGRGIFINDNRDTGVFIVWVGEEDQMRIMAMNEGSDVRAVWDLFYTGLEAVHKGVQAQGKEFAFKESHGYLSTCPTNLGTGMRASVHIDLPKFKTKNKLHHYVESMGWPIDIRGTRGEVVSTDESTVYDISNKERLGSNCYTQIKAMVDGVAALLQD